MPSPLLARVASLVPLLLAATAGPATGQTGALPSQEVPQAHDTGLVANPTAQERVVASFVVHVTGAPWLRLAFDQLQLAGDALAGTGARVRMISALDGGTQELDAIRASQWQLTSAYFNGDTVLVELVAPPFASGSRAVVSQVSAGLPPIPEESQCGATDDRVLSSDPRAARIVPVGCTGWLIDDCQRCFLTAGHCTGSSFQVVQFNVPLSTSGGTIQNPPPEHQYAIDPASLQGNGGQGVGNDWAYFGVFPNATTGLTPAQAQGATYTLVAPPSFNASEEIRITGYGTDSTPSQNNQVQQTHTGPWAAFTGTTLSYQADTTGGNSGSPVIHEPTGLAIGIHTHGGCTSTGGQNNGTASTHAGLQAALASPLGVCAAGLQAVAPPPLAVPPGAPTTVSVRAVGPVVAGSVQLHARDGAGAFVAQVMNSAGGGVYTAALPAFECGATPQYFFSAQSPACGLVTSPSGAPAAFFATQVGAVEGIFADSFEADLGWTVNSDASLTTGAWERGIPVNNNRGDPPSDADGSGRCFVTQNVAGNFDVDGGTTFLVSPVISAPAGSRIRWSWWLGSTGSLGAGDGLFVAVATDPAGTNWQTVRSYTSATNAWTTDSIQVGVDVPASATLRLRFACADAGTGHVVEGGVDAVAVERVTCSPAGTGLCFGDGTGTACPCGNAGATGRGCANSAVAQGARLRAFGTASVASDLVTLAADGLPGTAPALFFQGTATVADGAGAVFGDGLRCAAGTVVRLGTRNANAGAVALGRGISGDPSIAAVGLVPAGGGLRHYQVWYRNAVAFCTGDTFNLSNGLSLTWTP